MPRFVTVLALLAGFSTLNAQQLALARDTINVLHGGKTLKMPWANGINYSNASNIDLNGDGKKDLVLYDRLNHVNTGRFRCFLKTGAAGVPSYEAAPDLSYYFPVIYNWAVFYDYNCDGKEDLFAYTNSGIKVYRNDGSANNPVNFTIVKTLVLTNYNPGGNPLIGNIYASPVGVPGFSDIDNDGDLDILTFSSQGVFVEYHQNMSKEWYSSCDSLVFEYRDYCWGKFLESSCSISLNECSTKPPIHFDGKELHAGSCLTCIDSDNDGDKDLLMGDISCDKVQYAHNTGSPTLAIIGDTTILYPNYPVKNSTPRIQMNSFPCAYYVDVDGDNKKDLLATPSAFGSENFNSLWYYQNTSTTNTVNFQFVKKNFLQEEMIEVGQNSFPIVFDENADGLPDLLIGTYGFYQSNTLKSKLTFYRNVGTAAIPSFSLITQDFGALQQQNLFHLIPSAGDVDGDGDVDLVMGNSTGQVHWLENTAGSGNPCNFSVFKNNPFTFTTTSAEAAPQLFDMDQDGKQDLLIGMKNGRIAYYRNIGTTGSPSFTLITNTFGNVDVRGNASIFGIDGYAVPYFFHSATGIKLLVGAICGEIFYYDVPANLTQNFNLINSHVNNYNEGAQSAPCFVDVNNDGKRDLILGNAGGGLSFFSSSGPNVSLAEMDQNKLEGKVSIYPNPSNGNFNFSIRELDAEEITIRVFDLLGNTLLQSAPNGNEGVLQTEDLPAGIYLFNFQLRAGDTQKTLNKKGIKID